MAMMGMHDVADSYYRKAFGYTWQQQTTILIFILLQPVCMLCTYFIRAHRLPHSPEIGPGLHFD